MLELRAVAFIEDGEVVFCDEGDADAFGLYVIDEEDQLGWIADFADYGVALKFSEGYAEANELVFVDRVRNWTSMLP